MIIIISNEDVKSSFSIVRVDRVMVDERCKTKINTMFREAIEEYWRALKKDKIQAIMSKALDDSLFITDVDDCKKDFRHLD